MLLVVGLNLWGGGVADVAGQPGLSEVGWQAVGEDVYIYLVDDEGQVSNSQRVVVPASTGQNGPNPPKGLRVVPRPGSR